VTNLDISIPYAPRKQFLPYHNRTQRWAVMVCHRRAGKTVATINDLIRRILTCERPNPRGAYIAPFRKQAKEVAWDYLRHYALVVPGSVANESELRVDFPTGGRVRLYGADDPDALRGIYLDDVVLDEYAQMRPSLWAKVIRPLLTDREGRATFIGTPMGRNDFCRAYERGLLDPDWYAMMLKASESGLLSADELKAAKNEMGPDDYAQEFECSFDAAILGAYYGALMNEAQEDGRICPVRPDPSLLVNTAWDLGIGDSTSIWFYQQAGNEVRLIDFYETSGVGLEHYVGQLNDRKAKGWSYGEHILPHDANVKELGTGKSRVDTLRSMGINPRVLPALPVDDGISAARLLLPRCYFDSERCADGIEHLRQYRREYDERLRTFKPKPLHDEHSHGADAFRYLATAVDGRILTTPKRDRYSHDRRPSVSWMTI
jgi:phage terminase large subunit